MGGFTRLFWVDMAVLTILLLAVITAQFLCFKLGLNGNNYGLTE